MDKFEHQLICDYFSGLDRQGPGSPEATKKALSFIEKLPATACIADIGCGTGGQTMILAENTKIENELYEKDLYYKYKEYYGYVFFIGRKI